MNGESGKGDTPRRVNGARYRANFDAINWRKISNNGRLMDGFPDVEALLDEIDPDWKQNCVSTSKYRTIAAAH